MKLRWAAFVDSPNGRMEMWGESGCLGLGGDCKFYLIRIPKYPDIVFGFLGQIFIGFEERFSKKCPKPEEVFSNMISNESFPIDVILSHLCGYTEF